MSDAFLSFFAIVELLEFGRRCLEGCGDPYKYFCKDLVGFPKLICFPFLDSLQRISLNKTKPTRKLIAPVNVYVY